MFVYELSGSGFESSCSHLNFRFCACFEQGVPWDSGNYRVWIHSETHKWHDKNTQSISTPFGFLTTLNLKLTDNGPVHKISHIVDIESNW